MKAIFYIRESSTQLLKYESEIYHLIDLTDAGALTLNNYGLSASNDYYG